MKLVFLLYYCLVTAYAATVTTTSCRDRADGFYDCDFELNFKRSEFGSSFNVTSIFDGVKHYMPASNLLYSLSEDSIMLGTYDISVFPKMQTVVYGTCGGSTPYICNRIALDMLPSLGMFILPACTRGSISGYIYPYVTPVATGLLAHDVNDTACAGTIAYIKKAAGTYDLYKLVNSDIDISLNLAVTSGRKTSVTALTNGHSLLTMSSSQFDLKDSYFFKDQDSPLGYIESGDYRLELFPPHWDNFVMGISSEYLIQGFGCEDYARLQNLFIVHSHTSCSNNLVTSVLPNVDYSTLPHVVGTFVVDGSYFRFVPDISFDYDLTVKQTSIIFKEYEGDFVFLSYERDCNEGYTLIRFLYQGPEDQIQLDLFVGKEQIGALTRVINGKNDFEQSGCFIDKVCYKGNCVVFDTDSTSTTSSTSTTTTTSSLMNVVVVQQVNVNDSSALSYSGLVHLLCAFITTIILY